MSCSSGRDAERAERAEVEVLHVVGRRLQDHLVLEVVLEAERVLAVAAVGRADRRLDVGHAPRVGPEAAQEGGGVERARPDLGVVRRRDQASLVGPVAGQPRDHVLEARPRHVRRSVPVCAPGPRGAPDHWRLDRSSSEPRQYPWHADPLRPAAHRDQAAAARPAHGVRRPGRPGGAPGPAVARPPPDGRQRGRRLGQDDAGGRLARHRGRAPPPGWRSTTRTTTRPASGATCPRPSRAPGSPSTPRPWAPSRAPTRRARWASSSSSTRWP